MNNTIEKFNHNFQVPQLYSNIVKQDIKDPVTTFLDLLYKGKNLKVDIPSRDDINPEEKNSVDKPGFVEINFENKQQFLEIKQKKVAPLGYTRSPAYPTKEDKLILKKLHKVPVYSVINGLGEIVIASPRSLKPINFADWMYEKYFNNFIWSKDEGPVNMGLFFMHKEDAEMYLQEICAQDPKGVEEYGIDIKVSGLDNYYHLNKTSPPKTQIKLVGDLKEINLLIKDYSKDKNCRKNPKQQYTHNSFKGTPVYIMHPLYGEKYSKETKKNEKIIINYGENQSVKASKSLEQLIFFNKEDADRAWKIYVEEVKKNQTDIKVNKKPHLEVYNLENYLSDLQQTTEKKITNIRFIPSSESYSYIKKLKKQTIDKPKLTFNENLVHNTKTKLKSIQRFYKGVLWLFTSDTLPSEDNSW